MDMLWWHWIAIGLVLAGLELLTPGGFFIVFFGVGAILVGVLEALGMANPGWVQWLLFTVLSIAALVMFRKPLLARMRVPDSAAVVDSFVGEVAVPDADIAPGAVGRAQLRGSAWQARNVGTTTALRGQRCRVVRVDGLTVDLDPQGAH